MNHTRGVLRGMKARKRLHKRAIKAAKQVRYLRNVNKRLDAEIEAQKHQTEVEAAPETMPSAG